MKASIELQGAPAAELEANEQAVVAARVFEGPLRATLQSLARRPSGTGVELRMRKALKFDRSKPLRPGFDPWHTGQPIADAMDSPEFVQAAVAMLITSNRKSIEADGLALLGAVGMLLANGLAAPAWLAEAFHARWGRFQRQEVGSLDECFGNSPATERVRRAKQRELDLIGPVHAAVIAEVEADQEVPIDVHFFEAIGDRFGIGKTLCRELYDMAVQQHGMQDAVELKHLLRYAKGKGPKD